MQLNQMIGPNMRETTSYVYKAIELHSELHTKQYFCHHQRLLNLLNRIKLYSQ